MTHYPKVAAGSQPAYLHPAYQSTLRRAPAQPLISLGHTLSELTGPVYGHNPIGETDHAKAQIQPASAEEPQHLGRPRHERAKAHAQDDELVQIETTRK